MKESSPEEKKEIEAILMYHKQKAGMVMILPPNLFQILNQNDIDKSLFTESLPIKQGFIGNIESVPWEE